MKRKSIIAILLTLVMCFSLAGCGGNESNQNTEEKEITYDEALMIEAMDAQEVGICSKYLYEHNVPYVGISDFMNGLKTYASDNAFTEELWKQYESLSLDSKSEFENDFLEMFSMLISTGWGTMEVEEQGFLIEPERFGSAWMIGYDSEKNKLPYDAHSIILETSGHKDYPDHTLYAHLIHFDGMYKLDFIYDEEELKSITGIDLDAEGGSCVNTTTRYSVVPTSGSSKNIYEIEKAYTGVSYTKVDTKDVSSMMNDMLVFNSLFKLFVDNVYFDYDPYDESFGELEERAEEKAAEEQAKKDAEARSKQPEIGMTAEEIENGSWGKPDKKNITKTSTTVHEQWVYEDQGYVYLDNGIVTSIQYEE